MKFLQIVCYRSAYTYNKNQFKHSPWISWFYDIYLTIIRRRDSQHVLYYLLSAESYFSKISLQEFHLPVHLQRSFFSFYDVINVPDDPTFEFEYQGTKTFLASLFVLIACETLQDLKVFAKCRCLHRKFDLTSQ